MPDIKRHNRAAGHDIARARFHGNPSHRRHETGCRERLALYLRDPFGGACECILPHPHWRRPGVACGALEREFCAHLSRNDIDNGKRKIEVLEDGALLDVELEIAERIWRRLRIRNTVWVEAELPDDLPQRTPGLVGPLEQRPIERSRERTAAEKRC